MTRSKPVIGWDIGGAHVKAVMLDADGQVLKVSQQACALWKGLPLLEKAITQLLQAWQLSAETCDHVVTMTGELVDLFESRPQGVQAIAETVSRHLPAVHFYQATQETGGTFTDEVAGKASAIASMNWHASAQCLAEGLLHSAVVVVVDIGSTTCDVTLCAQRQVLPVGWTDAERMQHAGLCYTGVVRTPLMALGPMIEWQGGARHIAAEYFATTADVYRILGELPDGTDLADTADGQGKSTRESMRRIARMLGYDVEDAEEATWQSLALAFKTAQLMLIKQSIQKVIRPLNGKPVALVGLGAGSFLVRQLADDFEMRYYATADAVAARELSLKMDAEVCFPAYAVARLWQQWH
jgi:(4-(4-[2-(gamma-L-glutamylamino)ethyl]phenoxymethyl)furan-2-yl)methanamine synthase